MAPTPTLVKKPATDRPVGQQKPAQGSQNPKPPTAPFGRGGRLHIEQGSPSFSGIAINVASPGTFSFPLPSYGFLSAVLLTVNATGGTGVAAVYYEDAPWSCIDTITLADTNGTPLIQLSGYQAFLLSKYGGYRLFGTDRTTLASAYNAGSTAGNFFFILPIYVEFGFDGMGCLPNADASARYQLTVKLASGVASATGPIYTTAPTGYPTLALSVEVLCRAVPSAKDMFGNPQATRPPAFGTAQYASVQVFNALTGLQSLQFTRVGNIIRNHILIFKDTANGTRATAESTDLPTFLQMDWDASTRYIANVATLRQLFTSSVLPYDPPAGVIVLPNVLDPDWIPVTEVGQQWVPTVGATKLALRFTPLASCQLQVLTNDFVPASPQIYVAGVMGQFG